MKRFQKQWFHLQPNGPVNRNFWWLNPNRKQKNGKPYPKWLSFPFDPVPKDNPGIMNCSIFCFLNLYLILLVFLRRLYFARLAATPVFGVLYSRLLFAARY